MHHLKLIWLFIRLSIQNDAAYRADFFLRLASALVAMGGELLGIWTIFHNTTSIGSWDAARTIVLFGVFKTIAGLIGLAIAPNMRRLMEDIRTGTLDFVLTKPINAQFFISVRQIVVWRLIDLLLGLAMVLVGAAFVPGALRPVNVLLFLVLLGCGGVIIYSIWLALGTLVFWFTRIDNIEMVFWNMFEAGRYPIDIYNPWIRWALTYILPLAFLITFPASALVGTVSAANVLTAVIIAPLVFLAATAFWRYGLRNYSGASA